MRDAGFKLLQPHVQGREQKNRVNPDEERHFSLGQDANAKTEGHREASRGKIDVALGAQVEIRNGGVEDEPAKRGAHPRACGKPAAGNPEERRPKPHAEKPHANRPRHGRRREPTLSERRRAETEAGEEFQRPFGASGRREKDLRPTQRSETDHAGVGILRSAVLKQQHADERRPGSA